MTSSTKDFQNLTKKITDLESQMFTALKAANVGIWIWKFDDNSLWWDGGMLDLYEVKREDLTGTYVDWSSRLHPDDLAVTEARLAHCRATNEPFDYIFRIKSSRYSDGWRCIKGRGNILYNDNKPVGSCGINIPCFKFELTLG